MRYFVVILAFATSVAPAKLGVSTPVGSLGLSASAGCHTGRCSLGGGIGGSVNRPSVGWNQFNGGSSVSAGAGGNIGGFSLGGGIGGRVNRPTDGSNEFDGGSSASEQEDIELNCESLGPGYKYDINATLTENLITPDKPHEFLYDFTPTQNITFYRPVGPENPLMIEGYIGDNNNVKYFQNNESSLLNSCEKYSDVWESVLIEIAKKSLLRSSCCTIEMGNYTIPVQLDPIIVASLEKIQCGQYVQYFNAYEAASEEDLSKDPDSKWTWLFQLHIAFEILDNGNCK